MARSDLSPLRSPRAILALRVATWACVVALAVLSLLPGDEMVRTGANGRFEHFIAYAGTMLVAGLAYGGRLALFRIALPLIAYAGALEIGQNFSPGRTPAFLDFAAGTLGVCAGVLAVRLGRRRATAVP